MTRPDDWPRPPIAVDDLPKIRPLLTEDEWLELLRRHWSPGPLDGAAFKNANRYALH